VVIMVLAVAAIVGAAAVAYNAVSVTISNIS